MRFEWRRIGEQRLVTAADVPQTEWPIIPCYGSIHRTADYPDSADCFRHYKHEYELAVIEGTKIGGVPHWVQPPPRMPKRFLCAMGSIGPVREQRYPWINVAEPIPFRDGLGMETLGWGDAGSLYIFLDWRGRIRWTIQGY